MASTRRSHDLRHVALALAVAFAFCLTGCSQTPELKGTWFQPNSDPDWRISVSPTTTENARETVVNAVEGNRLELDGDGRGTFVMGALNGRYVEGHSMRYPLEYRVTDDDVLELTIIREAMPQWDQPRETFHSELVVYHSKGGDVVFVPSGADSGLADGSGEPFTTTKK